MMWDDDQTAKLNAIRDAYNSRQREYILASDRSGDTLILHDGGDARTDLKLHSGDYEQFVEAGFLRVRTRTFSGDNGTVSQAIRAWDEPLVAPAPATVHVGPFGTYVASHGPNSPVSNVAGGMASAATTAGDLRRELVDAMAREIVAEAEREEIAASVDDAIAEVASPAPQRRRVEAFMDAAIRRAAPYVDTAAKLAAIGEALKAIFSSGQK